MVTLYWDYKAFKTVPGQPDMWQVVLVLVGKKSEGVDTAEAEEGMLSKGVD